MRIQVKFSVISFFLCFSEAMAEEDYSVAAAEKKAMNFDEIVQAFLNPSSKHTMLYINVFLTVLLLIVVHFYLKQRRSLAAKNQPIGVRSLEDEEPHDDTLKSEKPKK